MMNRKYPIRKFRLFGILSICGGMLAIISAFLYNDLLIFLGEGYRPIGQKLFEVFDSLSITLLLLGVFSAMCHRHDRKAAKFKAIIACLLFTSIIFLFNQLLEPGITVTQELMYGTPFYIKIGIYYHKYNGITREPDKSV